MKAYSKLGISVLSTLLDISGYRPGKWLMCPLWVKVKLHIGRYFNGRMAVYHKNNESRMWVQIPPYQRRRESK